MSAVSWITVYLTTMSLFSIFLTLHDKDAARRGLWRVKERTLLLVSALGGSVAMLVTMRLIRHKTKHFKFMFGIPAIIVIQLTLAGLCIWQNVWL